MKISKMQLLVVQIITSGGQWRVSAKKQQQREARLASLGSLTEAVEIQIGLNKMNLK
jgi:hypothetical protein